MGSPTGLEEVVHASGGAPLLLWWTCRPISIFFYRFRPQCNFARNTVVVMRILFIHFSSLFGSRFSTGERVHRNGGMLFGVCGSQASTLAGGSILPLQTL